MASHYRFYAASNETVVPFNATYQFPSQANKAVKSTPRIVPKNGAVFSPGNQIRFEFPASGYMNVRNTTFIMDVTLTAPSDANSATTSGTADKAITIRFQNNIQSIFSRVRIMYGSTVLEDIRLYNVIVRCMTEWTANSPVTTMDQSSINEGIGGVVLGIDSNTTPAPDAGLNNVRATRIHGVSFAGPTTATSLIAGTGNGYVPYTVDPITPIPGVTLVTSTSPVVQGGTIGITRRYQFQIIAGLFQQPKLIPLKYMASQFIVEFTLETPANCIVMSGVGPFYTNGTLGGTGYTTSPYVFQPTYAVGNFVALPEILEFDPSYDESFLEGLYENGVPIPFCSWHTFDFSSALASVISLLIQERSRSVKALFAVQQRAQPDFSKDNGATLFDTGLSSALSPSSLQQTQWRIGARYFPAQPVQTSTTNGSGTSNGGVEAYTELAKALNIVGDYRLSTPANVSRWALMNSTAASGNLMWEYDFTTGVSSYLDNGTTVATSVASKNNSFASTYGAQCYASAINLETTNGVEISGLNAEEQSDIQLNLQFKTPQTTGIDNVPSRITVFAYYDAMLLLKQNNEAALIQ